jgi:hypothetical protein
MPDNKSVKVYPLCQMFLLCQLINRSAVFTMPTNQSISQLYPVCQANQSIVSCIHHASQSTNQSTVSTMPANQSISQLYPLCQQINQSANCIHYASQSLICDTQHTELCGITKQQIPVHDQKHLPMQCRSKEGGG